MWIKGRGVVVALLIAVTLVAGAASADNNPNGSAFRAVGWFRGKAEISLDGIKCEIPNITSAIADGFFTMGLWNTFGFGTYYFPDVNHPFGNPCGGYVQLQNNLFDQAIQLERVTLKYKILHARRFRQFVPTRKGFPIACGDLRSETLFLGAVLNPINSNQQQSGSGSPNVTFVQVLPMVPLQIINCLRSQYAALSSDLYSSLKLVIRARAIGVSDAGDSFVSNPIAYTLDLRHTCGNGRVDDTESCDPSAPFNTCLDSCLSGACEISGRPCATSIDCAGSCVGTSHPSECACIY